MAARAVLVGALAAAMCGAGVRADGHESALLNATMDANATMDMNATDLGMNESAGANETEAESEEGRRLFGLRKLLDEMDASMANLTMDAGMANVTMDMNASMVANVTEGDDHDDHDHEDHDTDTEDEDTDTEDEN